ncbi:MAG: DUF2813 domain-containing protein [Succinivibrio sp.]|nr:DUF2813 domain-containing protein [Succinivibrio sp.]
MFLEGAEVHNFRGIRHLKIDFEPGSTVLIGENSWGKTSLLRALWMVLGRGNVLCEFAPKDLYVPVPLFGETVSEVTSTAELEPKSAGLAPARRPGSNKRRAAGPAKLPNLVHEGSLSRPPLYFGKRHFSHQESSLLRHQQYLANLKARKSQGDGLHQTTELSAGVFSTKADHIEISLIFRESDIGDENILEPLVQPYWFYGSDGLYRIHYRVSARYVDGRFSTVHELLDKRGNPFPKVRKETFLYLIAMNPVLRLRDRRMNNQKVREGAAQNAGDEINTMINPLMEGVALSGQEMHDSLQTLNALLQKYFSAYNAKARVQDGSLNSRNVGDIVNRPISLETLQDLQADLESPKFNKTKLVAALLAGQVSQTMGGVHLDWSGSPIIILEDIESRFHPSLLLSFWSVLEGVKMQKIVTTNSGDLLSALPLSALRRLQREYYDTLCYKIGENNLSKDDLRRIAFHIRLNRPMTLFARSWLLVEGETEIWMLSEAAALLGISLQCEGIRPVEFAQCGLQPLIKLARLLGIRFFVLTDGDEAGEKYAQVVRSMVGRDEAKLCLYMIPQVDIEHYLYCNGYAEVFRRCTGTREMYKKGIPADKIIDKAIRHMSKPGLALAVIDEMQKRGPAGVPRLFRTMFHKLNESQLADNF